MAGALPREPGVPAALGARGTQRFIFLFGLFSVSSAVRAAVLSTDCGARSRVVWKRMLLPQRDSPRTLKTSAPRGLPNTS